MLPTGLFVMTYRTHSLSLPRIHRERWVTLYYLHSVRGSVVKSYLCDGLYESYKNGLIGNVFSSSEYAKSNSLNYSLYQLITETCCIYERNDDWEMGICVMK